MLPSDDPELARLRTETAGPLYHLGHPRRAVDILERELPRLRAAWGADDPRLIHKELNLATMRITLGDAGGSLPILERMVVELQASRPSEDKIRLTAEFNLANNLRILGLLHRARPLFEHVLEHREVLLPPGHPNRILARMGLAAVTAQLGDLDLSRELFEANVAEADAHLPAQHPLRSIARTNLAIHLRRSERPQEALVLFEDSCAVLAARLPPEHPDLLVARLELAETLRACGQLEEAVQLHTEVLLARESSLPADHVDISQSRSQLAKALLALDDLEGARELFDLALASASKTLPVGHAWRRGMCIHLAFLDVREGRIEEAARSAARLATELRAAIETAAVATAGRDLSEQLAALEIDVAAAVSLALALADASGAPRLEATAFELVESLRGARRVGAHVARRATDDPAVSSARERLADASREVTRLAVVGADSANTNRASRARDLARRAVHAAMVGSESLRDLLAPPTAERLASRLAPDEVAVSIRRLRLTEPGTGEEREAFVAWTVAPGGTLVLRELAAADEVERAVVRWRASSGRPLDPRGVGGIGSSSAPGDTTDSGRALRDLVLEPLRANLEGASRITLAVDDVLLLAPLDALPADDTGVLGDEYAIELRASLAERLFEPPSGPGRDLMIAVGGVRYTSAEESGRTGAPPRGTLAFAPLPGTRTEASAIAELGRRHAGTEVRLLVEGEPTKERLLELLPRARYAHVATHGFFAPELATGGDAESSGALAMLSPMTLCGLALAGASGPTVESSWGAILTAEELASLDLVGCELATLSACDTSLGVRRASRGIASLRTALHDAGARSVVTSLWEVADEPTRVLMTEFYRRLWVEGEPKGRALWNAKALLRSQGHSLRGLGRMGADRKSGVGLRSRRGSARRGCRSRPRCRWSVRP